MIQIANPFYNEAFKYLMGDQKAAWVLLSALLGEDIELLELLPQENAVNVEHVTPLLSRVRFGYVASVRIFGKRETVFVELQKCTSNAKEKEVWEYFHAHYPPVQPILADSFCEFSNGMPVIAIYIVGFDAEGSSPEVCRFTMQGQEVVPCTPFSPDVGKCLSLSTPLVYFIRLAEQPSQQTTRIAHILSVFAQQRRYEKDDKKLTFPWDLKMDPIIGRIVSRLESAWADDETRRKLIEEEASEKVFLRSMHEAWEAGFKLGVARNMLPLVADDAVIAAATGLTVDQVRALRAERG